MSVSCIMGTCIRGFLLSRCSQSPMWAKKFWRWCSPPMRKAKSPLTQIILTPSRMTPHHKRKSDCGNLLMVHIWLTFFFPNWYINPHIAAPLASRGGKKKKRKVFSGSRSKIEELSLPPGAEKKIRVWYCAEQEEDTQLVKPLPLLSSSPDEYAEPVMASNLAGRLSGRSFQVGTPSLFDGS